MTDDISNDETDPRIPPPVGGPALKVWSEVNKQADRISALTRRINTLELRCESLGKQIKTHKQLASMLLRHRIALVLIGLLEIYLLIR